MSGQGDIIMNRVFSEIQLIKKGLSSGCFHSYNDLLIIAEIIPKLPRRVLANVLVQLRVISDQIKKTHSPPSINIKPLLEILGTVREETADHLLNDFLCCSCEYEDWIFGES